MRTAYQDRIRNLLDQHGEFIPFEPVTPLSGPLLPDTRKRYHNDQCVCEDCAELRAAQDLYHARKRAAEGGSNFGW